jgi:hypothetical protein
MGANDPMKQAAQAFLSSTENWKRLTQFGL